MKPLTQESLTEAIATIKQDIAEQIDTQPRYIFIQANLRKWADRLINPWKGKRAVWLRRHK